MRWLLIAIVLFPLTACVGTTCESFEPDGPACEEGVASANARGREHEFGLGEVAPGTYEVLSVQADGFRFRFEGGREFQLAWPEALPVAVAAGDEVVVESTNEWIILTLPRGQLAVADRLGGFAFSPPDRGPDGTTPIGAAEGCVSGDGSYAAGVSIGEGNDEVRLLPGESAVVGEWSYGLVYAWVVGPEECVQGDALVISEGMGAGALVAYRSLDAAADRSGE